MVFLWISGLIMKYFELIFFFELFFSKASRFTRVSSDEVSSSNTSLYEQLCRCARLFKRLCYSDGCVSRQLSFQPRLYFIVTPSCNMQATTSCGQLYTRPQEWSRMHEHPRCRYKHTQMLLSSAGTVLQISQFFKRKPKLKYRKP